VNFLTDAQLPPALARWIVAQGHQAVHVFDTGLHTAHDGQIWEFARMEWWIVNGVWEPNRGEPVVIVSKDEDFADRWLLTEQPVRLVWIRKGNCSNEALLAWLEPLWPDIVKRLDQGERLIEVRA
jgi:predicted nuclease of predicted toxin-antitoxin system